MCRVYAVYMQFVCSIYAVYMQYVYSIYVVFLKCIYNPNVMFMPCYMVLTECVFSVYAVFMQCLNCVYIYVCCSNVSLFFRNSFTLQARNCKLKIEFKTFLRIFIHDAYLISQLWYLCFDLKIFVRQLCHDI